MRNFSNAKRIVVKIGTNTLSRMGEIDTAYVRRIAGHIAELIYNGRQLVLVTSGAIGMGAGQLKTTGPVKDTQLRQACAAIGQPLLMAEYRKAFTKHQIPIAQVLLTAEVLNNRKTYLNLRKALETLLKLKTLPVINENDCVSTEEIGSAFGDNDRLSALVASKIDADLLIMLTDIDRLYDSDPRKNPDANPFKVIYEITPQIEKTAGKSGSIHATGGMKTKIDAAKIASDAGCRVVIANGRARNIIPRIINGSDIGTLFMPRRKLSNRLRWILNSKPAGTICVDKGAIEALKKRKSLLPSGITEIKGTFEKGDVVMINNIAKTVTKLSAAQLRNVAGQHSSKVKTLTKGQNKGIVAIPEDIVFLDY